MVYVKNEDPWAADDLTTIAKMDNFETIYTEASNYLSSHNHDALYPTQAEMQATYWYAGNDGTGSGSDADLIYKSTGNLHAASFAGLGVPTGLVILWYGLIGSISAGWHICDGTGGTIDLTDRFPVGAGTGSSYVVGAAGGANTFTASGTITVNGHSVTVAEMGTHRHPFVDYYYMSTTQNIGGPSPGDMSSRNDTTPTAGSGSAHGHSSGEGTSLSGNAINSLPFSMALCYIQKIAA